jgi:hypothetical protein
MRKQVVSLGVLAVVAGCSHAGAPAEPSGRFAPTAPFVEGTVPPSSPSQSTPLFEPGRAELLYPNNLPPEGTSAKTLPITAKN